MPHKRKLQLALVALVAAFVFPMSLAAREPAPDDSSGKSDKPRITEKWVTVQQGERKVRCLLTLPAGKEKAPVVLVIHEIFGLSDWAQGLARQVAEAGYVAVAPDLLSGIAPGGGGTDAFPDTRAAVGAVRGLPQEQVTADLDAVANFALKQSAADGKLAVAGFCWGGRQSFLYATHRPKLSAAFVFYGTPPEDSAMKRIACPVYGFYGSADRRVGGTIPATTDAMKAAGKQYEPVIYDGARHGFMRGGEQEDGAAADKQARQKAWTRWKKLLKEM